MKYIGVNCNKYDLRKSSKKGFDFLHLPVTITGVRKAKSFAKVGRKATSLLLDCGPKASETTGGHSLFGRYKCLAAIIQISWSELWEAILKRELILYRLTLSLSSYPYSCKYRGLEHDIDSSVILKRCLQ